MEKSSKNCTWRTIPVCTTMLISFWNDAEVSRDVVNDAFEYVWKTTKLSEGERGGDSFSRVYGIKA